MFFANTHEIRFLKRFIKLSLKIFGLVKLIKLFGKTFIKLF